jgi:cytochrome c-type biogenesis protein
MKIMAGELSLLFVFSAGILSFLSPCVLPLIPSYLSILGGVGLKTGQRQSSFQPRLLRAAVGFVLGFSVVFITLGILVSTTFSLMGGITKYINWAAGIIVIVLGLNVIFDFLSFLNYEKRPLFQGRMRGIRSMPNVPAAFVAGAAFGAGWTPCIGPILTAILLMAGQSGKTGIAAAYLALYSSGLAVPFILAALFFDSFLKHGSRFRSHLPLIRRISGILLIIIGIMILSGRYSALNILIQRQVFSYISWAETKALPFRLLADALAWLQRF